MKKLFVIIPICLVVLVCLVLGCMKYQKSQMRKPEYMLRAIAKALITREDRDVDALNKIVDSEYVIDNFISNVHLQCLLGGQLSVKTLQLQSIILKQQLNNIARTIQDFSTLDYQRTGKWPAKITEVKYQKKKVDGKLEDIALASVEVESGLTFVITMEKEDGVWIPSELNNASDTVCKWIPAINKYVKQSGEDFDRISSKFLLYVLRTNPDPIKELDEYYAGKFNQ